MKVLSKFLRGALAGIAVIAGVGSLFALGIMYGVKAAYAEAAVDVPDTRSQQQFVFVLEDQRQTGGTTTRQSY